MKFSTWIPRCIGAFALLASLSAVHGQVRSSTNYTIVAETQDGGGRTASSANYSLAAGSVEPGATGTSVSSAYSIQHGFINAEVVAVGVIVEGRWVFYNHSAWDGKDASANAGDDDAIATDKSALLPGSLASFANYTSYSRGINGIMVDIANLPGTPVASDFEFQTGNDHDPAGWADAPVPASITVREGAGLNGSDRITLIWNGNNLNATVDANEAVAKAWLQVTVKATVNTGLAADDVFYFGNAIGDTGDSANNSVVNSIDELGVRLNARTSASLAPVDDTYDIDRDRLVNSVDELYVRLNATTSGTMLVKLDLSASSSALAVSGLGAAQATEGATNQTREPRHLETDSATPGFGLTVANQPEIHRGTPVTMMRLDDGHLALVFELGESGQLQTSDDMGTWSDVDTDSLPQGWLADPDGAWIMVPGQGVASFFRMRLRE